MADVVSIKSSLFNSLIVEKRLGKVVSKKMKRKREEFEEAERKIIGMVIKIPDPLIQMEVKCDMFTFHMLNMFVYRL